MINAIKNIKTEKTEKQKDNEWKSVIGHKTLLLNSTDWTQLEDVFLSNKDEFVKWRRNLRKTDLKEVFDSPEQATEFLKKYEDRLPKPVFNHAVPSTDDTIHVEEAEETEKKETPLHLLSMFDEIRKKLQDDFEQKKRELEAEKEQKLKIINDKLVELEEEIKNQREPITDISLSEAHRLIISHKKRYSTEVIVDKIIEFPILLGQVEQALDFLSDDSANIEDYYLLDNSDVAVDNTSYAHSIIDSYKNFLKEQKQVKENFAKELESVYDMTLEEVNEFFETNGYRYRCSNQG